MNEMIATGKKYTIRRQMFAVWDFKPMIMPPKAAKLRIERGKGAEIIALYLSSA